MAEVLKDRVGAEVFGVGKMMVMLCDQETSGETTAAFYVPVLGSENRLK